NAVGALSKDTGLVSWPSRAGIRQARGCWRSRSWGDPSMAKTVSVGICAYNEAQHIGPLIDSLQGQTLPPDFVLTEILVVASGCTDGTDRIIEERAKIERRLTLIRESERRGKSSAINQILSRYGGDILVLVNADARLLPGALFGLLDGFDGDESVD